VPCEADGVPEPLAAALTSDHHFTQAGFEALLLRQPS